ncbi:MAG TPA: hypothetical protein VFF83_00845 [Clostridia bacterium]|jgi:hypothetical protein|nr:hypothetical protein [Clostridia bacterium]
MGEGSIINRIVSMIKRGNRKFNTEFGSEGGPILKKGTGRQTGSTGGGSPGPAAGDVYSKQEKIQEKE